MNQTQPKAALDEVESLRTAARRTAHASWLPLFVFGVLTLGAVPFALLGDDGYDGFYWLVAGPLGGALTWQLVQRRGSEVGIFDRRTRIYAAIIAAMVAGALIIGWSGGDSAVSNAGTLYPIAAGLVAIGAISRNLLIPAAGVAIAAWGTAMLIAEPEEIAAWSYAGEGVVLLVAGIATLAQGRPAAMARVRSGVTAGG